MKTIYSLIEKTSKKSVLLALIGALVIWNVLMNTPGLPTSTPSMQKIAPSFTPFDLQASGYSVETFTRDLTSLGEEGRAIYQNFMLLDIFFPLIYGLTFASLIFLVFRAKQNWLAWLFLGPLITAVADYLENIFIAISFARFPTSNPLAVSIASGATQLKMLFNVLLILSLIITLIVWIASLFSTKSEN
jgi:hypothetical protein